MLYKNDKFTLEKNLIQDVLNHNYNKYGEHIVIYSNSFETMLLNKQNKILVNTEQLLELLSKEQIMIDPEL